MGKRERYEPGTFCWTDLVTTDPAGAKAFYGGLFGWETEDTAGEAGGTYTMLRLGDDEVCALYEMEPERRELGIPSHWFCYVSVDDVEETAARARELGGTVHGGPFDSFAGARMAIIEDPAGAVLAAWQPGDWPGASRVNDVGCMAWNELQTRDPDAAAAFYEGVFGWTTRPIEQDGRVVYTTIENAGSQNGGFMPMTGQPGEAPPYWLVYFTVSSCDDAIAKAKESGGEALAGPMQIGDGRIAVLTDPQDAAFAIFEGETDD